MLYGFFLFYVILLLRIIFFLILNSLDYPTCSKGCLEGIAGCACPFSAKVAIEANNFLNATTSCTCKKPYYGPGCNSFGMVLFFFGIVFC
jgi:hypothetical protein